MILLVRAVVSFPVGVAVSWIVYAFAGSSVSGNGYAAIACGVWIVAFLLVGQTQRYRRFRRGMWERRLKRMG